MKVFVFDANKCNGCYACQLACKDEHCGNDWMPYALPQPDTGHFWCNLTEKEHGSTPKIRIEYKPIMCAHCDNAPCMEAAPDAVYKREDGMVIIDPEKAKGNEALKDACPIGAIYWNDEFNVAQKCTGCAQLLDEGDIPHCVDLCMTEALRFGDEEDFAEEIAAAETLVDAAYGPRVYYLNLPHLFIAGDVWDPVDNDVIEGAKVVLSGAADAEVETDEFGDFWFNKVDAGDYAVTISADGFKPVTKEFSIDASINLGDFPLERA